MKAQLAARDLQLDKKHIELLQMTAKEESARAAAASALEQVVQFEQEAQNLRKGPGTPDSQEMKQMHARMVECIQVIKALNERIGEEAMKNTQLVAKNKVLEEGMGAQETEIKDMATQLEANKNILLQTRDQYARSMASWSSAKSHVEKEKADYELKLRELKDEASRLRWAFFAQ
jgi:chromosome segregation ATPase